MHAGRRCRIPHKGIIMNKINFTPIALAIAVLLSACSSMPKTTSLLDQTHSDYATAQSNPNVARYASLEMKQAGDAMNQADAAAAERDSAEKIDKLAYLAKQKIALTQEVAKQKSAEASVAAAGKERDQMRLDQRTNEADQANANAMQANANAEQSRLATQTAQNEAAESLRKQQEAQAHSAQLEAQLADLAAKKTERGLVITLGDVLFGNDKSSLNSEGMRTAQKLADILKQNPQRTVLVEGFTDSTGAAAYNQELSERRATSVRNALQDLGVARDRVAIRGYGETYPVAANDTANHRQTNRRVEIVISDATGKIAMR
jgi:outer membrane protein OmpA-like peptidoglycan-associated protein